MIFETIIAQKTIPVKTLAKTTGLRYYGRMNKRNVFLRLLALFAALCLLAGCAMPTADEVDELLQTLESAEALLAEEAAEPDAAPASQPEETPLPPDDSLPVDPDGIGAEPRDGEPEENDPEPTLDPDGWYTTKEDVARYLFEYGTLPGNFITKDEARALGWSGGGLDDYAPDKSIGGDRFGNYEGLLPEGSYHECDIDTMHASSRGAKRIVYSDDGRVYYTDDHYESFTQLYPGG